MVYFSGRGVEHACAARQELRKSRLQPPRNRQQEFKSTRMLATAPLFLERHVNGAERQAFCVFFVLVAGVGGAVGFFLCWLLEVVGTRGRFPTSKGI
jgi:hypothetical protein